MGVLLPHFNELAVGKTALLALDDATKEHYIKYALAVIVSSGYSDIADDDHTDNDAGHLAIVELTSYLFANAGTVASVDAGTIKKESLGSWSVEYALGDEAQAKSSQVLPPIVKALLTKYLLVAVVPVTDKPPAMFANPANGK